nr:transposase, MuDR, MULE transposase domain protein [Tanacetum cinerariifolium]
MDGNNQIFPTAFGICKGETGLRWSWWMSILKECIGDNPNLLFISEMHATIALEVQDEFPLSYHDNQVGDLSTHTTTFISSALTQKVFANMRRVMKGFSGVKTPLFEGMLAARQLAEEGIAEEQVQADDAVAAAGVEFPTHFQQVLDTCSALTRCVENLEHDKAAQKLEIIKLKARGRMIDDLDKDEGIELVVDQVQDADIAETEGRHAAEQAKK